MIKKLIFALAVAIVLPITASAQKFGYVDANSIFTAMPGFTAASTKINEATKTYEEEYKKLQEEMDKLYQEFQNLPQDTPDTIKERRLQELQEKDAKAARFRQTAQEDLQRLQQTELAPVQQDMLNAIKAVGEENGFTFIFPQEVPLYVGKDAVDVTPLVRARLNLPAAAAK